MRIAVAMSGGADSTASALILTKEGHEVIGLHMELHSLSHVSWERARKVGVELDIPVYQVDLKAEFDKQVVRPFVEEYTRGRTPSPCLLCNYIIKMTRLLEVAVSYGSWKMATGHYARVRHTENGPDLLQGADTKKDQSYFLALLNREMLTRVVFPLGEHTKDYARGLLEQEGIHGYQSDESQELCFVPNGDYKAFLANMGLESLPGLIVDVSGKKLGEHSGIEHFTIGQRKGLGVSAPYPLYVVGIDPEKRIVVVGPRKDTFVNRLAANRMNYLQSSPPSVGQRFHVKVRSTSNPELCTVMESSSDSVEIEFDQKQSGVAPGQAAVLYSGERVVGGGWIENVWLSQ